LKNKFGLLIFFSIVFVFLSFQRRKKEFLLN